jgi:hypothetical protein
MRKMDINMENTASQLNSLGKMDMTNFLALPTLGKVLMVNLARSCISTSSLLERFVKYS